MTVSPRSLRTLFPVLVIAATALTAADKPFDPCSLMTPAEIQAVVGKPVQPGKPKVQSNPMAGADCTYVVGDFGSLNALVKPLQSYETPAAIRAQFVKMKMNPVDLTGVGDAAFFTSPGFGMVQLHAFKNSKYVLFTLLVPGAQEPAVRDMAGKLMKTALGRIK
jgi:hypothetical protein